MQRLLPPGQRVAYETRQLELMDRIATHNEQIAEFLRAWRAGIQASDPAPKFWQETLDPVKEVVVRYEGRARYAIYTTTTSGTKIKVALFSGFVFEVDTTAPGWLSLDYPAGTRLYSADSNRYVILVRASNLSV